MDVIAQTNDGGVSNLAVVTWTGDGTVANINCGFKPRYVKVLNLTDRIEDEKFYEMTDAQGLHRVAAGTATLTTSSDIVLHGAEDSDFRGFAVAAATNITGKVFHAIAHG